MTTKASVHEIFDNKKRQNQQTSEHAFHEQQIDDHEMECARTKDQSISAKTFGSASIHYHPSHLNGSEDKVQLHRWAYETSRQNLTVAENLEKLKWEEQDVKKRAVDEREDCVNTETRLH